MSNIFVCVPTMNDRQFIPTLERMLDKSKNPDNIFIATTIFWKNKDIKNNRTPFFLDIKNKLDKSFKKVKYDIKPWHLYPGVGAGRLGPTKHFNNEKYFLSIDSHTDFEQDWDNKIIDIYENSRKYFGKRRVITAYLSPLDKKDNEISNRWQFFDFYHRLLGNVPASTLKFPLPNDRKISNEDLAFLNEYIIDGEYVPAKKISAHFYFTESDPWLTKYNLNLDESINFWGEEFYQSSLSYSRGYNLVWQKTNILYHDYSSDRSYKDSDLDEFNSIEDIKDIYKNYIINSCTIPNSLINKSFDDNEIIDEMFNKNFGYNPRSIKGFLNYSNIDLINRKTSGWWEVPKINVIYK